MRQNRIPACFAALFVLAVYGLAGSAFGQTGCSINSLLETSQDILLFGISRNSEKALAVMQDPQDGSPDVFELNLQSGELARVTDFPDQIFFDDLGTPSEIIVGGVSPSADLSRFLFTSPADFSGANPNNAFNSFLYDRATEEIRQITNIVSDSSNIQPGDRILFGSLFLSPDGRFIAAEELQGLEDDLGVFAVENVVLIEVETGARQQLTFADRRRGEGSAAPFLGEGFHVAGYSPDSQWLSLDAPDGSALLHHIPSGEQVEVLGGMTGVGVAYISEDADFLILASWQDLTGQNPDGSPEFFRLERESGQVRQLTDRTRTPFRELHFERITVSSDGSAVAYQLRTTDLQPNGLQIDRTEQALRWLDIATGQDVLIAHSTGRIVVDENGNETFVGEGVLAGGKPRMSSDGRQIFYDASNDLTAGTDMPPRTSQVHNYRIDCGGAAPERFFPQIGDGVSGNIRFRSNIVLTNAGAATGVDLRFFDTQGNPLEIELQGIGRASRFELALGRGRTLNLISSGESPLEVGYASLSAPGHVNATAVFMRSEADSGVVQYEAGVPLSLPMGSFSLPVDTLDAKDTGLAMVAPKGGEATLLHLGLYDESFQLLGEREITLEAGHHLARFVGELFPSVALAAEMRGTLTVSSQRPVPAVALRQSDDPGVDFPLEVPTLTAFPVTEGRAESSQALLTVSLP